MALTVSAVVKTELAMYRKFTSAAVRKIGEAGLEWIQVGLEDVIREDAVKRVLPIDIVDESTG